MQTSLCLLVLVALANAQQINLYTLSDNLVSLESQNQELQSYSANILNEANQFISASQDQALNDIYTTADQVIAPVNARLAALEVLASDFERITAIDVPSIVNSIKASVSQSVANQAVNRGSTNSNLQTLVGAVVTAANTGLSNAATSRAAQRASMVATRASMQSDATTSVSVQIGLETSRAAAETLDFNSQLQALTSTSVVVASMSLASEASRADSAVDALLAGVLLPNQTGTTNDYANCTSGETGTMYYSNGNKGIFVCDGQIFGNFLLGAFSDSTLLNRGQINAMVGTFGHRWILCYRASRDSYQGYIFHRNCDYKGPTVSIFRNGAGRIYGGFIDQVWASSNRQRYSHNPILYRFDPSANTQINLLTIPSSSYSSKQYSFYDEQSYGPCYGSTGDIYTTNGISQTYTCPNYYTPINSGGLIVSTQTVTVCGVSTTITAPISVASPWTSGYDCNSLAGGSGTSGNELEVYYMA